MSNPTREQAQRLLTDDDLPGPYWNVLAVEIAEAYIRALDVIAKHEELDRYSPNAPVKRLAHLEKK